MKLHEKLGLTLQQVDTAYRLEVFDLIKKALPRVESFPINLHQYCVYSSTVAVAFHLVDDHRAAFAFAQRVTPAARNYLLGDWRVQTKTDLKTIDPGWWHDKESWINVFRVALCWGSVLGDWKTLRELAAYPDEHRSMEKFNPDSKPALRRLLLNVARHLRGNTLQGGRSVNEELGAKWRGIGVLGNCLDAINDRNEAGAGAGINEFLRLHHKRKKSTDINDSISLDATYMTNLAYRQGLKIAIDPRYAMYLISPPNES